MKRRRDSEQPPIEIKIGRCLWPLDYVKKGIECYACGNKARDWPWPDGPALVGHGLLQLVCHCGRDCKPVNMPICESCFASPDITCDIVYRKYVNAADDLEIKDGGKYSSVEQIKQDIADATDATKH